MKTKPIIMMKNCALTIPKAIREEQGLEPGDCFDLEVMPDGSLRFSRKECCHVTRRTFSRFVRWRRNT